MDENAAHPKQPPFLTLLDWVGLRQERRVSVVRFVSWFKQPSNFLSVAAIVAVIIVPWIDKIVKADEELRTRIDTLIASTNKVIKMNQERVATGSDVFSQALLTAQRQNELARASAIAASIKRRVYPSVLSALANELCASGSSSDFEEAQSYLREVLKRGSGIPAEELSQAHVISANCYVRQFQMGGEIPPETKKRADDEMSAAVTVLGHDNTDRSLGQLAITYAEWAHVDERMGDTTQAQSRRAKAEETVKRMRFVDSTITAILESTAPTKSLPSPVLKEDSLPRTADDDTYIVAFPDNPDEAAALVFVRPDAEGHYKVADGTLYLYRGGLFTEADDVSRIIASRDMTGLTGIQFQRSIPIATTSGRFRRIDLVWTIEAMDRDRIAGVQSQVGRSPRRFVARRSPNPRAHTNSITAK